MLVTVNFKTSTWPNICTGHFSTLCSNIITEIVFKKCSILTVLGLESIVVINEKFAKWQENKMKVKLVRVLLNADRCITSCIQLYSQQYIVSFLFSF